MTIADIVHEKLQSSSPEIAREVLAFLEFLQAKAARIPARPVPSFDPFFGTLKGSTSFDGDAIEIQRRLRDEWGR